MKMYVLTRKDLDKTYSCVQGGHALAQFAIEHPDEFKRWENTYLIYLGVSNLIEMRLWEKKLLGEGKRFSTFHEPDLDGQCTAIACYDDGEIFRNLRLA